MEDQGVAKDTTVKPILNNRLEIWRWSELSRG